MHTPTGSLRFAADGARLIVQLHGRLTMNQALALRRFAETRIAGGVKQLRLDLRHCTYLDSTMLGTLLCLQRSMDRQAEGALVLDSPSAECDRLLRQIGIADVLPTVREDEPPGVCWSDLPAEKPAPLAFKRHLYECHDELARAGNEQIRLAAECLAKEVSA